MSERKLWKEWADRLRQEMMENLTPDVTMTIANITAETTTTKSERTLRSERFWRSCQTGKSPNDILIRAGFEIDFEQDEKNQVDQVTLRLNDSWSSILQGKMDRLKRQS